MNFLHLALRFDRQEQPREAAWAYEIALQAPGPALSTYYNLIALYFAFNDTGFFAAHHLPKELVDAAYDRAMSLMDQAERDFGWDAGIQAWRHHLRDRVAAVDVAEGVYERLARHESADLARLLVYLSSNGQAYADEVRALFLRSQGRETELQRYIHGFARD